MVAAMKTTWAQQLNHAGDGVMFPEQVHRVLLYGAPGTGKSSWAGTAFAHVERIALHPQEPQET